MTDSEVKRPRRKTVETYYAIRIGTPGKHHPYFMLRDKCPTPWLFMTRSEACEHLPADTHAKVMKVKVST